MPVVLLHAFPLSADMWRPQLARVPDEFRFLAPDLRGFGFGAPETASSMDEMADGVLEWLEALGIDTAVIGGLSMGGYVTFALWRKARERFSAMVLADTRATADTEQGRAARAKMLETVKDKGVTAVADEMLPKLLGETSKRERQLDPQLREIILRNHEEGVGAAIEAMRDRPDATPLLAAIDVPALVLVGEEDTLTPPSDSEALHAGIRGSRLVRLPRAGHISNLEVPDEFSTALNDFLVSLS